ncbi:hypothetical protein [Yinghuangia soli]|uniref:Uncharacterized protein n=1 Tax=Yinghuangia soli TaxID=2908204 RepID=A0AA41U1B3_9ACTN|nr:hypothetical protein [Yinghuangia soli]MCF2529380.1 hypothetical protein [Yinghuangia soli]
MTKYTPNFRLPYPEPGDQPRGDTQIQALATAAEKALGSAYLSASFSGSFQLLTDAWGLLPLNIVLTNLPDGSYFTYDEAARKWTVKKNGYYRIDARLALNGNQTDLTFGIATNAEGSPDGKFSAYSTLWTRDASTTEYAWLKAGDTLSFWAKSSPAAVATFARLAVDYCSPPVGGAPTHYYTGTDYPQEPTNAA